MSCLLLAGVSRPAAAEDLSLRVTAWNGLSHLVQVAGELGVSIATPSRLDVAALKPADALLIIHPKSALPVSELAVFLRNAGRLAVLDDFDSSEPLLSAFGVTARPPPRMEPTRLLRGNRNLLIATPESDHPLARGVPALVTNHPSVLRHNDLPAVFTLGNKRDALVLTGAVGNGRLVVVSDSSVLINNMLQFQGNRAFAENLVRYLTNDRAGTLYILDSESELFASLQPLGSAHPLRGLSSALARIAELRLPPAAIMALSTALACLLGLGAWSSLPRRGAYARRFFLRAPQCHAGFAGRVAAHARDDNLAGPLLAFKYELEARLTCDLKLQGQPLHGEVLEALRRARLGNATVDAAAALLAELEEVQARSERASLRVSRRKFSQLVATGERILAELDERIRV